MLDLEKYLNKPLVLEDFLELTEIEPLTSGRHTFCVGDEIEWRKKVQKDGNVSYYALVRHEGEKSRVLVPKSVMFRVIALLSRYYCSCGEFEIDKVTRRGKHGEYQKWVVTLLKCDNRELGVRE